ncbi:patched domain-containing protein 3-like isoform X2 [Symsagittifera roscoffensis]
MPTSGEVERELLKMEKRCGNVVLDKSEGPVMKKKVRWAPCNNFHRYIKRLTGTISTWYGCFLTENPWVVILINLFFATLLLCGLFINESLTDFEALMTPNNSASLKDRRLISDIFYEHGDEDYIPSHNPYPPLYAEALIVPRDPSGNLLSEEYLVQIIAFEYFVYSEIQLQIQGRVYKYTDLCAKHSTHCVKEGITKYIKMKDHEEFFDKLEKNKEDSFSFAKDLTWPIKNDDFLPTFISNTSITDGKATSAQALKLRWYLRQAHDTGAYDKSLSWLKNYEEKVMQFSTSDNFLSYANSECKINITFAMSETLNMLLNSAPPSDTYLFIISYIFVLLFTMFVTGGTNWVTSRSFLAGVDVIALGMATVAALGMVGMLGTQFVSSVSIMPLLVIGNGLDDLFIFMSAWKKTSATVPEEIRVAQTLRRAGYPITISSVASLSAFLLSTFTDFENVNNFCVYSASAVAWCFVVQMTFFGSCLAIHARRVNRYRHCLSCMRVKTRLHLQREGEKNPLKLLCCAGNSRETSEELDSLMQKFVKHYFEKLLLNPVSKAVCILLYLAYMGAAIYGVIKTERGVSLFSIVEKHSSFAQHLITSKTYFNQTGVPMMLVFTEPIDYHKSEVRDQIFQLTNELQANELIEDNFTVSWLNKFMDPKFYDNPKKGRDFTNAVDFGKSLKHFLENEGKNYAGDVIVDDDSYKIVASRFHFQAKSLWSSNYILASDFMVNVREIATQSKLPAIVFSGVFIYYEQYTYLIKTAVEVLVFSVLALFGVSVLLVPSLMIAIVMTLTVISINVGVLGFMYFWDMKFSIITLIDVILSTAYVMDFAVHICLGYIESDSHTKNARVRDAIENNGVPIFNGALCTSAAISVFAVAESYLFRSFFKTCLLVICIGVIHCLLFTPVILSLIGPIGPKKNKAEKSNSSRSQTPKNNQANYDEDDFPFFERQGFLTKSPSSSDGKNDAINSPGAGSASTRVGEKTVHTNSRPNSRHNTLGRCVSVQTSSEKVNQPTENLETYANMGNDQSQPAYSVPNLNKPAFPPPRNTTSKVNSGSFHQLSENQNSRDTAIYSGRERPITSAFTRVDPVNLRNPNYNMTFDVNPQQHPVTSSEYEQFEFYGSSNSLSSAVAVSPSETKV